MLRTSLTVFTILFVFMSSVVKAIDRDDVTIEKYSNNQSLNNGFIYNDGRKEHKHNFQIDAHHHQFLYVPRSYRPSEKISERLPVTCTFQYQNGEYSFNATDGDAIGKIFLRNDQNQRMLYMYQYNFVYRYAFNIDYMVDGKGDCTVTNVVTAQAYKNSEQSAFG